jgi:hypothetical protein
LSVDFQFFDFSPHNQQRYQPHDAKRAVYELVKKRNVPDWTGDSNQRRFSGNVAMKSNTLI